MAFLDENGVAQFWAAVKDRLAGAFDSVEFDVAEQAANLMSGDSIATAFGKLAKNYSSLLTSISDLNTNLTSQINTKLNKSDVLANYTTTATGKALDASLGPAIKTKMDLADTVDLRVRDMSRIKKWTPKLYDFETYLRDLSTDAEYMQVGGIIIAWLFIRNPNLSGINTMMQIRNTPMTHVIGGGLYVNDLPYGGSQITIQNANPNRVYFRPNIKSTDFSDLSNIGNVSFWIIGY